MEKFNYLVLGSGIAGLSYAVKMAEAKPEAKIAVVTKTILAETNTRYAQGGIAVVQDFLKDSFTSHVNDTMIAGDFLNNPFIVEMVVREAPERIAELIQWGVDFDKERSGRFNLNLEGGHSTNRIIHHKDLTGFHIENCLLKKCRNLKNIYFFEKHFVLDLLVDENICYGAEIINGENDNSFFIYSDATVIATGGAGQMYSITTNPEISTGDGVAIAGRAGAVISDMQFIQFHPTALYESNSKHAFLISEAVRGYGAVLRDEEGRDFMLKYDPRGSLATRDVISRAIFLELKKNKKPNVWLDCRNVDLIHFKRRFPNIYKKCCELNIDLAKDLIPVTPAAHYICGGIKTDQFAATNIYDLYAIGECASTGLHGANRLASNSLLEALVFAHSAVLHSLNSKEIKIKSFRKNTTLVQDNAINQSISKVKLKLREEMTDKAGIVKTTEGLMIIQKEVMLMDAFLTDLFKKGNITIQNMEFRNLLQNCSYVINHSLEQKQNKGTFYNSDLVEEVSLVNQT